MCVMLFLNNMHCTIALYTLQSLLESQANIFFCISQTCFAEFRVFSQVAKTVRICAKKKTKKNIH